jgi:hypothetical protein
MNYPQMMKSPKAFDVFYAWCKEEEGRRESPLLAGQLEFLQMLSVVNPKMYGNCARNFIPSSKVTKEDRLKFVYSYFCDMATGLLMDTKDRIKEHFIKTGNEFAFHLAWVGTTPQVMGGWDSFTRTKVGSLIKAEEYGHPGPATPAPVNNHAVAQPSKSEYAPTVSQSNSAKKPVPPLSPPPPVATVVSQEMSQIILRGKTAEQLTRLAQDRRNAAQALLREAEILANAARGKFPPHLTPVRPVAVGRSRAAAALQSAESRHSPNCVVVTSTLPVQAPSSLRVSASVLAVKRQAPPLKPLPSRKLVPCVVVKK